MRRETIFVSTRTNPITFLRILRTSQSYLSYCWIRLDSPFHPYLIDRGLTPGIEVRAEALALHTAGSSGGAQFYMTCYQITVTGSGSASPATVKLPGAYAAADPGILVDIHAPMSTYIAPGPTVYSGGSTKSAGAGCAGCESTCAATQASGTAVRPSTTAAPTTLSTSAAPGTTTSASSGGGANCAAKYAQCGGQGWTGATCCQSGSTCSATNQVIIFSP